MVVTKNLNRIVDHRELLSDIEEVCNSNMRHHPIGIGVQGMRHHPIGIGVQGLAYAFQMLKIPFESDAAKELNDINLLSQARLRSCELATAEGPHETYEGSPASESKLHAISGQ